MNTMGTKVRGKRTIREADYGRCDIIGRDKKVNKLWNYERKQNELNPQSEKERMNEWMDGGKCMRSMCSGFSIFDMSS